MIAVFCEEAEWLSCDSWDFGLKISSESKKVAGKHSGFLFFPATGLI